MKTILVVLLSLSLGASAGTWEDQFENILSAQGKALDSFVSDNDQKSLPQGFELKELITDFGLTKQGLFGIAAVKSTRSIEVKWKRIKAPATASEKERGEGTQLVVDESTSLDELTSSVAKLARASGHVKNETYLETSIKRSLSMVEAQLNQIDLSAYNGWKLDALRLDLNFGADGQVSFLNFAGAKFRVRLEWKIKERKPANKMIDYNGATTFVAKVMHELGSVTHRIKIPGFTVSKVSVGAGVSNKRGFGLWKYSAGFVGALIFVPRPMQKDSFTLPAPVIGSDFVMGGVEDETNKGFFRRVSFTRMRL